MTRRQKQREATIRRLHHRADAGHQYQRRAFACRGGDEHAQRGIASGVGLPIVGATLSASGVDAVILTFVDFDDGLDRFQRSVLPGLEARGLRAPVPARP